MKDLTSPQNICKKKLITRKAISFFFETVLSNLNFISSAEKIHWVLEPSRYRVASMGEIRETIFMGLRRAKTTVRNDTKMQMSIIVSENRGT